MHEGFKMLQREFMHVKLKDLRERIQIDICENENVKSIKSFAYTEKLIESKSPSKKFFNTRVIFIFPKNKVFLSRSSRALCLHWNCKRYITFDVFTLTPHLLICQAFEDIASVQVQPQI